MRFFAVAGCPPPGRPVPWQIARFPASARPRASMDVTHRLCGPRATATGEGACAGSIASASSR